MTNVNNCVKFTLFSDLHYKKGMYIASVDDMKEITASALKSGSDLVLHAGDMCNDYKGSVELIEAYLNNAEGLDVYGVYGNHELESKDNSMSVVTPRLTNASVVWGTPNGELGDGSIAYYYFDKGDFRFICLDTNYSYSEEKSAWEHNGTASHCAPKSNILPESLGTEQLSWLESVLFMTVEERKHAILVSHSAIGGGARRYSPDAERVLGLISEANKRRPKTVIMSINGHYHENHVCFDGSVVYIDTNTVRNGFWNSVSIPHYTDETFVFEDFDESGNSLGKRERAVSDLWMSPKTWYFDKPLFATVTVNSECEITVDGKEVGWLGNIDPNPTLFAEPFITSSKIKV